jgi:alpha-tubulin suppressor-like RCC1 family protein
MMRLPMSLAAAVVVVLTACSSPPPPPPGCANDNAFACGATCQVCEAPTNGQATCSGGSCGFSCDQGYYESSGACLQCEQDNPLACGATCQVCEAPANAAASCQEGTCGFTCNAGYVACTGGCCKVQVVAAGGNHTCVLTDAGGVRCWGKNDYGQLGIDTAIPGVNQDSPVDVPSLTSGVAALAAGQNHTCAVLAAGGVKCWGRNNYGQLGNGATIPGTSQGVPVDVTGVGTIQLDGSVKPIAAGADHTCVILASGTLQCWGRGTTGQLGNAASLDSSTPVAVSGLTSVKQVDGGGGTASGHTCAVVSGGTVSCWGQNASGQLGKAGGGTYNTPQAVSGLTGVAEVALGSAHTCARLSGGTVQCFGFGASGQLGNGGTTSTATPTAVSNVTGASSIAAGQTHACVASSAGVKCWGQNGSGQLGNGAYGTTEATPVSVAGISTAAVLFLGDSHSCAITASAFFCWGLNQYGQVGDGGSDVRLAPATVSGLVASRVSGGLTHTCALTSGGAARCWGRNSAGQLGTLLGTDEVTPAQVSGLTSGAGWIAAGGDVTAAEPVPSHSCAVDASGAAKCWGDGTSGQLGNVVDGSAAPVQVTGITSGATAVATGGRHSCAIVSGAAKCWGRNVNGQLGNGLSGNDTNSPVQVTGLDTGVTSIVAGNDHTCAVKGGALSCWGNNTNGQVGNNSVQTTISSPAGVTDAGANVTSVAAGLSHTCAIVGGVVKCWGWNNYYQLGDGTNVDRSVPVSVSGLGSGTPTEVATGAYHSCAVLGGAVKCWGQNNYGQLGDGTTQLRTTPVGVSGLASGVMAISSGANHTCALLTDGAIRCWGYNRYGQIGDGGAGIRPKPVVVVPGT